MIANPEIKTEAKPELTIEYLPNGLWRLWVNGNPSHKAEYQFPIFFEGCFATTAYWGEEKGCLMGPVLGHKIQDHTL